jgi:hypothetical protein
VGALGVVIFYIFLGYLLYKITKSTFAFFGNLFNKGSTVKPVVSNYSDPRLDTYSLLELENGQFKLRKYHDSGRSMNELVEKLYLSEESSNDRLINIKISYQDGRVENRELRYSLFKEEFSDQIAEEENVDLYTPQPKSNHQIKLIEKADKITKKIIENVSKKAVITSCEEDNDRDSNAKNLKVLIGEREISLRQVVSYQSESYSLTLWTEFGEELGDVLAIGEIQKFFRLSVVGTDRLKSYFE